MLLGKMEVMDAQKVFWSWQNDYSPDTCRHFIRSALKEAVQALASEMEIQEPEREGPQLDHDTQGVPGWADINASILAKIAEAAVFVANITPIAQTKEGKALPNPNVLVELGYALGKNGFERERLAFFHAAYSKIFDLYGWPSPAIERTAQVLGIPLP